MTQLKGLHYPLFLTDPLWYLLVRFENPLLVILTYDLAYVTKLRFP